jgi:hypothetical protein
MPVRALWISTANPLPLGSRAFQPFVLQFIKKDFAAACLYDSAWHNKAPRLTERADFVWQMFQNWKAEQDRIR